MSPSSWWPIGEIVSIIVNAPLPADTWVGLAASLVVGFAI